MKERLYSVIEQHRETTGNYRADEPSNIFETHQNLFQDIPRLFQDIPSMKNGTPNAVGIAGRTVAQGGTAPT